MTEPNCGTAPRVLEGPGVLQVTASVPELNSFISQGDRELDAGGPACRSLQAGCRRHKRVHIRPASHPKRRRLSVIPLVAARPRRLDGVAATRELPRLWCIPLRC